MSPEFQTPSPSEEPRDPYLNLEREKCVRCGQDAVGSAGRDGARLCHGDHEPGKPTCYMLDQWESARAELGRNR